jgi:hypothetical protein
MAFLEESSDVAKQTISDLKEALTVKEIEVEELKIEMNKKKVG